MSTPTASEFFIIGIDGTELSSSERSYFHQHALGGIILFKRNIESLAQVVRLNQALLECNAKPPIISVDQEGGRVARLRGICTDVPPLQSLREAFLRDHKRAYRIGAMQARELAALGFHLNFAPVCDVLSENSEVIGDRAFSSEPLLVATLAHEYIKGLQGAGIAGCAKHFPGHGATKVDSHLALPVLDTRADVLHEREFVPFKSAILADVATIMTAHIITRSIDVWPATMSEKTLTGILRQELGFNNLIISDDLTMKAVADNYSLREILERGFAAGVDLFIIGNDFPRVEEAVAILDDILQRNQSLKEKALLASARIAAFRRRYLGKPAAPDLHFAQTIVRALPHLELVASCQ